MEVDNPYQMLRWRFGPWHVEGEKGRPACEGQHPYDEGTEGPADDGKVVGDIRPTFWALCGYCRGLIK